MLAKPPKYVHVQTDRHGKTRVYFRQDKGKRIPLPPLGSADFEFRYQEALGGKLDPTPPAPKTGAAWRDPIKPGTLRWLCTEYFRSDAFLGLDESTRRVRRQIIEHCLREPTEPGATTIFANFPLDRVSTKAIKVLRDRKKGAPEAANGRVKAFRQVYAWAIEAELADDVIRFNPARDVAYKENHSEGFHPWSLEEVEQFERVHPIGTKAHLALALLLYTGQRRSDVVRLGRQHLKADGWLHFRQFKGRKRKPVDLELPIIPELRRIIDASPTGDLTFLVTSFGIPFTRAGFGNRMRKWCDEAGLPECSAHGLRKAAAARLAMLGCTDREIMAITGHTTVKEVDRYTRGVRRRKLAENVLVKVGG